MAKMKVYELAQEIGVKSAEILTVLKSKGIEVKSHMSVLEDEQIAEVRVCRSCRACIALYGKYGSI